MVNVVAPELIAGKKILLRLDLDVPIKDKKVVDDYRLKAGLTTLKLCLEHAQSVTVMGHLGRPGGKEVPGLSVEPIYDWLCEQLDCQALAERKIRLLENLRFEKGEEECSIEFAKELIRLGSGDFYNSSDSENCKLVYINEAFAAFHPAASTVVLPKLLPHAAGLRFAEEVKRLTQVLENPKRPLVGIIGGAKVADKLPAIQSLAKIADVVLVGGKLVAEIAADPNVLGENSHKIVVAKLNEAGTDITPQTCEAWQQMVRSAKMVLWSGPLGKVEDPQNDQTKLLAEAIVNNTEMESIVGGGDSIAAFDKWELLGKFTFVSTGGGAMLKFLADKTLPTIEALK